MNSTHAERVTSTRQKGDDPKTDHSVYRRYRVGYLKASLLAGTWFWGRRPPFLCPFVPQEGSRLCSVSRLDWGPASGAGAAELLLLSSCACLVSDWSDATLSQRPRPGTPCYEPELGSMFLRWVFTGSGVSTTPQRSWPATPWTGNHTGPSPWPSPLNPRRGSTPERVRGLSMLLGVLDDHQSPHTAQPQAPRRTTRRSRQTRPPRKKHRIPKGGARNVK